MILEVQTGMVCRGCNNAERLDTERRKTSTKPAEASHCASAKRTVHPSEETEEYRAATKVVTERHIAVSMYRRQFELGSGVTCSYRTNRFRHCYLLGA